MFNGGNMYQQGSLFGMDHNLDKFNDLSDDCLNGGIQDPKYKRKPSIAHMHGLDSGMQRMFPNDFRF